MLKYVNKVWGNCDFVITNHKIIVGVNYDQIGDTTRVDLVFVSLAGHSSQRTLPKHLEDADRREKTL